MVRKHFIKVKMLLTYHLWVIGPVHPTRDELQRFFLHGSHGPNQRLLGDTFTVGSYGTANVLTHHLVKENG